MDPWAKQIRYNDKLRYMTSKRVDLSEKSLAKIRASRNTKRIIYPQMKEAYEYVHNLYPNANILNVVALHTNKYVMRDAGYKGVGGFYNAVSRVIVISDYIAPNEHDRFDVHAEYTLDEVLCHELIHYGANAQLPLSFKNVEEEIAYTKCIGYLRQKGRSDAFIVEKNMMPYLISVVDKELVLNRVMGRNKESVNADFFSLSIPEQDKIIDTMRVELAEEMLSVAKDMGYRMIASFDNKINDVESDVSLRITSRRKLIIDDDI